MCVVSMVTGMGQEWWPDPSRDYPWTTPPYVKPSIPQPLPPISIPPYQPLPSPQQVESVEDYEKRLAIWWEYFQKMIKAAEEFDKATGQPDCIDPEKEKWLKKIEKRVSDIEKKLKGKKNG